MILLTNSGSPASSAVSLVFSLVALVATCLVFKKAGKPWWAAIIPIYSAYVLFDILFGKGIKFLWMFVPIVNIYWMFKVVFSIGKVFGKGVGFGFLMLFLSPVAMCILAFSDCQYQGPLA